MHGSFEKQQQDKQGTYQSIKPAALAVFVIVVLVRMLASHPVAVKWISDAAQAEFVGPQAVGYDLANGPVWP